MIKVLMSLLNTAMTGDYDHHDYDDTFDDYGDYDNHHDLSDHYEGFHDDTDVDTSQVSDLPVLEVVEQVQRAALDIHSQNLPVLEVLEEPVQKMASTSNSLSYAGGPWAEEYGERAVSYMSNGNAGLGEYYHNASEWAERNGY